MNKFISITLVSLCLILPFTTTAEQMALTTKETAIWKSPNRSSEEVLKVAKDTPVEIVKRKGGWYQVNTDTGYEGWVPLLQLRFVSEEQANEQSIANILRQTAEMPTAAGVTSGVRGMTSERLNSSDNKPRPSIEELDQYIPTDESVDHFAEQGELKSQDKLELQ